jgi:hypothetical protein
VELHLYSLHGAEENSVTFTRIVALQAENRTWYFPNTKPQPQSVNVKFALMA